MNKDYTLKILLMKTYLDTVSKDIDKIVSKFYKPANQETVADVEKAILHIPQLATDRIKEIEEMQE